MLAVFGENDHPEIYEYDETTFTNINVLIVHRVLHRFIDVFN